MRHNGQFLTALVALLLFVAVPSTGQKLQPQETASPALRPERAGRDPIRQLNLTPEQREQIRTIREQNQQERAAINQRVRETNQALELVLDSDSPEEAVVEQRMREASSAQAEAMRMRILTEVRIRRVLTPEQRGLLRTLRREANQMRRERQLNRPGERLRRRQDQRGLENEPSRVGPLLPRRELRKRARPAIQ